MNKITVLGIDLAKDIFQLHGVDQYGKTVLKKQIKRARLTEFVSQLSPCIIGMEACGGANFWAREFGKLGHEIRIVAAQFVRPFVKSNKNDAADAEAIAEAVIRPNMRFVAPKQVWQQDIQTLHRTRQLLVRSRVAVINSIHGLSMEYGVFLPRTEAKMRRELADALSSESERFTVFTKQTLGIFADQLKVIDEKIKDCNLRLEQVSEQNETCKKLLTIPGVGVMTATAAVAAIGDPKNFKNGRQFSAWLGLVPRQCSSGGKNVLLGISKRGDGYLRCLLIHGSRAVLNYAKIKAKTDYLNVWALKKEKTRGKNRAIVALANKNARIIWAIMSSGKPYEMKAA